MTNVSVCIPVHNEENSIGKTLNSILAQRVSGKLEVLVCANDCTDSTEDIVISTQRNDSRVKLLSTTQKGKAVAWNYLFENANYDQILFTDGDVTFLSGAIDYLSVAQQKFNVTVAKPDIVPDFSNCDFLSSCFERPSGESLYLTGRGYLVSRAKLQDKLRKKGYESMPTQLLSEDHWLSLVVGTKLSDVCYEERAKIQYTPYHWTELKKMLLRDIAGQEHIKKDYPALWEEHKGSLYNLLYRFNGTSGFSDRARGFTRKCLKTCLKYAYDHSEKVKQIAEDYYWETSAHSKK